MDQLREMLLNATEHYTGNHSKCGTFFPNADLPVPRCCQSGVPPSEPLLKKGSPTHVAIAFLLDKYFTKNRMAHYTRARETDAVECLNSLINKCATPLAPSAPAPVAHPHLSAGLAGGANFFFNYGFLY